MRRSSLLSVIALFVAVTPVAAFAQSSSAGGPGSGSTTQAPPGYRHNANGRYVHIVNTGEYDSYGQDRVEVIRTPTSRCEHWAETHSGDKPGPYSSNGGSAGNSGGKSYPCDHYYER